MTTINIQPMQWAAIPAMGSPELRPFSPEDDAECFRELRDVLKRHGALERFGVFLIHKHFDIAEDEQMTECTDHEGRQLVIEPRRTVDIDLDATMPTNWVFTDTDEVAMAYCTCARGPNGHYGYHRKA